MTYSQLVTKYRKLFSFAIN